MRTHHRPGPRRRAATRRPRSPQHGAPPGTGCPSSVGSLPLAATADPAATSAAVGLAVLLDAFFPDGPPVPFRFWDGSTAGPDEGPGTVVVRSPDALRYLLWSPGELGLGRAFVAGTMDIEGDIISVLARLRDASVPQLPGPAGIVALLAAIRRTGALGRPMPTPREEAHPRGVLHSKARDAAAISHHYDVGNEFYRLVLGPSMTYSCARFVDDTFTLEAAQRAKFDLVCRKLGLHERHGAMLLDVGCGWGSLAMHAAQHYGARVIGVSISREQVDLARHRVESAGLDSAVDIRLRDYRDLAGLRFDAISSVGMFEHVGARRIPEYFATLRSLLGPGGRLLNHAISSVGGSRLGPRTFVGRYVFPDGELIDVGQVVLAMESAGFEVRDLESLREHYERTLREWVANLESSWTRAVQLVGPERARVWRLYMAGSANGFHDGGIGVHQVLGVVPDAEGHSGMPPTRAAFV